MCLGNLGNCITTAHWENRFAANFKNIVKLQNLRPYCSAVPNISQNHWPHMILGTALLAGKKSWISLKLPTAAKAVPKTMRDQ